MRQGVRTSAAQTRSGAGRPRQPEVVLGEDDSLTLTTVGVDIGSATSQIAFSRIVLERAGGRYETTSREVLFESEVLLTPFTAEGTVDADVLQEFFADQYVRAGVRRETIDTGAVILTGVALLRRNAEAIATLFAADSGRFVSVAAGDHIEALLAAHGSGAVEASRGGRTVMNVDVGGGTTKLSLCRDGRVESVAAVDVGSRLVAWDESGVVLRVEPAAHVIAKEAGLALVRGETLSKDDRELMARCMAEVVADAVIGQWEGSLIGSLLRTAPIAVDAAPTEVTLSGGMARYVEGTETRSFGDFGPLIAAALPTSLALRGVELEVSSSAIRATVVGSSQFTVQVSGTTIHISGDPVLPLRNVPVATVTGPSDVCEPWHGLTDRVRAAIALSPRDERALALAVPWNGSADLASLSAFSSALLSGAAEILHPDATLVLVLDQDVAGLVGANLLEEFGYSGPLVVVDGIELERFDFVDVGEYLEHTSSVPITIKSLAF